MLGNVTQLVCSTSRACSACAGIVLTLVACGGTGHAPRQTEPAASALPPASSPETMASGEAAAGESGETPLPPIQIVAGTRSPIDGPLPQLTLQAPKSNQRLIAAKAQLRATLQHWPLSADGNHVHLIIDNRPYIALRDLSQPLDLAKLYRENFAEELPPGSHVIRMFPSRPHHESVKVGSPFVVSVFHVQEPTAGFAFDPKAPLLTYSRPKGCYPPGERLLLDFYVSNATLGVDAFRVQYTVDDVQGEITDWVPHYIENLPPGEHTVRLALLDAQGEPVAGAFNDTVRSIRVADDCSASTPSGASDHAGH